MGNGWFTLPEIHRGFSQDIQTSSGRTVVTGAARMLNILCHHLQKPHPLGGSG
ncbi:hypothetical protein Mapa_000889 [Marchantia paleacea]|nr:hypothetical protein Mapa_000889 [Marchantia paleacea]